MPKKNRTTKYDDYLGLPIEKAFKKELAAIAKTEERSMTDMARVLLRLGVTVWKEQRQTAA